MTTHIDPSPTQVVSKRPRPRPGCTEEFSLLRSELGGGVGALLPPNPTATDPRPRPGPSSVLLAVVGAGPMVWRIVRRPMRTADRGMTTAEYAVGTVAACAFAAILYQVVTGGSVVAALGNLIQSALSALS